MTAAPERTLAIDWDADARQFHLRNDRISYLIRVLEDGTLGQLYFGPTLAEGRGYAHLAPGVGMTRRVLVIVATPEHLRSCQCRRTDGPGDRPGLCP